MAEAARRLRNGCENFVVVDAGQQELFDEMTAVPLWGHDDLLDAAMSGVAEMMGRREMRVW